MLNQHSVNTYTPGADPELDSACQELADLLAPVGWEPKPGPVFWVSDGTKNLRQLNGIADQISGIADREDNRFAELERLRDIAEDSGRFESYDERRADINEDRATDLAELLDALRAAVRA